MYVPLQNCTDYIPDVFNDYTLQSVLTLAQIPIIELVNGTRK
jgi:hypothetical protein